MATVVVEKGRILLGRRAMEGECAGLWEFPGGKVEEGESDEMALVREFDEEFGVELVPVELIAETSFVHRGRDRVLAAWSCHRGGKAPLELRVHLELRWCLPEETRGLEFVESDGSLLPRVLEWLRNAGT